MRPALRSPERKTFEGMTAGTAANRDAKFFAPKNRLANGQRCFAFNEHLGHDLESRIEIG